MNGRLDAETADFARGCLTAMSLSAVFWWTLFWAVRTWL